jgi:hypothetical protein
MAQKEFFGVSVEKLHLQGFVGQVNTGHLGCCNAGEQAKRKKV